jgi:glycine oxidase
MGELSHLSVNVGGAGVFGLSIALELTARGAEVDVYDPSLEANASAIAAGMLAPALEAALDPLAHRRFALLKAARDLWPAFAEGLGVSLQRDGANFRASEDRLARVATRLTAEGAAFEMRNGEIFTPEDWRIEPRTALAAMRKRLAEMGGTLRAEPIERAPGGEIAVLACGYQAVELAPELAVLSPIRGQLLRFPHGPSDGPVLRAAHAYLAPSRGGTVVGATMDEGRDDLAADPASTARLLAAAEELSPGLSSTPFTAHVGVRAAAPDGLPIVGPSIIDGVWVAAGARRNGWLLAPMVAQVVADGLARRRRTEAAALFASDRFRSTGGEEPNPPG